MKPTPKPRPRFSGKRVYTPAKFKQYEGKIRERAKRAMRGRPPVSEPVFVKCFFYFKKYKKKVEWRTGRPDLDNLAKAVIDSMNGIVYDDDARIAELYAVKKDGPAEAVEVEIWRMP